MRIAACGLSLTLIAALPVHAQCPDGSPPPCGTRAAAPHPNSVAVLHFSARDTADVYRAEGLTEDIATLLGRVTGIEVKAPSVVRGTRPGGPEDPRVMGQALHVRYVVEGSLRHAGSQVHVTARLVEARSGVTAWGDAYDRAEDEMLVLPSVIAREISARVGGSAPGRRAAAATLPTRNPDAYDHYLRGNFFLAQRGQADLERAIHEYEDATEADPAFASALGRAAYSYALARITGARIGNVGGDALIAIGLAKADRAIRLDSGSSDAWMARGFLLTFLNPRTLAGAREAFERAIAADPRNAEAHHQFAQVLNLVGDHAGAERQLREALSLDPQRAISFSDLAAWTLVRDLPSQQRLLDSALAIDPQFWVAQCWRANVRLMTGDLHGAGEDARAAAQAQPGSVWANAALARVLAREGDTVNARQRIAPWIGANEPPAVEVALALLELKDTTAALSQLEHAQPGGEVWVLLSRPEFDGLRSNPRFIAVMDGSRPPGAVER